MTAQGLSFIRQELSDAGINYSFGEWAGTLVYPYFVGDYIESPVLSEYGESECLFTLTGTADGSRLSLERVKEKIMNVFPDMGRLHTFEDGNAIAVFYSDAFYIPTGTVKYKRMQINLKVKEWSVI